MVRTVVRRRLHVMPPCTSPIVMTGNFARTLVPRREAAAQPCATFAHSHGVGGEGGSSCPRSCYIEYVSQDKLLTNRDRGRSPSQSKCWLHRVPLLRQPPQQQSGSGTLGGSIHEDATLMDITTTICPTLYMSLQPLKLGLPHFANSRHYVSSMDQQNACLGPLLEKRTTRIKNHLQACPKDV